MKKRKIIKNFLIINIIFAMMLNMLSSSVYAAQTIKKVSSITTDSEEAWQQIKSLIKTLQKKYPNWNFKVFDTGLDWNTVISGETKKHSTNLVQYISGKYSGDWICSCGYKAGSWYCASESAIEYMMDPRNSINASDIFQFMQLSYDEEITDEQYTDSITNILEDTFMDDGDLKNYVSTIIDECKKQNVNPCYIAVKIIQEQGTVGGSTYKIFSDGIYYYNIFNINATVTSTIANALAYAKKKDLTTVEKCLIDGINFIASGYLSAGQNTLYFEKYDVVGTTTSQLYSHQYAQDVLYAQNQGTKLLNALKNIDAVDYAYTFVIPLYNNMPKSVCARPSTTTTTTTVVEEKYTLGDANSDGKINSGDLLVIKKHLLGTKVVTDENLLNAMDVNKDGKINSGDLLLLKKYLLGKYELN